MLFKTQQQVTARRDNNMPPPIAADLHPCTEGSAVCTALRAACLAGPGGTERQTDGQTNGRIAAPLNAPVRRGHNNNNHFTAIIQGNFALADTSS